MPTEGQTYQTLRLKLTPIANGWEICLTFAHCASILSILMDIKNKK